MQRLIDRLRRAERAVVFTGAGVSTLSGIPDFRSPQGLYRTFDAGKLFDIDSFRKAPAYFGEMLPEQAFAQSARLAGAADLMLVLGTSLVVQPAASLSQMTVRAGGEIVIVTAGETPYDDRCALRYNDLAAFAAAVDSAFPACAKA